MWKKADLQIAATWDSSVMLSSKTIPKFLGDEVGTHAHRQQVKDQAVGEGGVALQ